MTIRFYFILSAILIAPHLFSQNDLVTVTGEAQVDWTPEKSEIHVKREAEDAATIDALERAFGRMVIQGNSTYLKNINTGKLVETNTIFNSIGNSFVKGDVVEVLHTRFEEIEGVAEMEGKKSKTRAIRCTIRLKAKPVTEMTPDFTASTLGCPDPGCRKNDFKDNDPLFLAFQSPSSGFLSVFLDDGKYSQQLLPYSKMADPFQNGIPVTAGEDYLFFSKEKKFTEKISTECDEYVMAAESPMDQLRMYILFSSTPLNKLTLVEGSRTDMLTEKEKASGYKLPKEASSEDFQRWLISNQQRKKDLRVMRIDITVTKR